MRGLRIDSIENALVLFEPPAESDAPKSPSHIPVLSKAEAPMDPPITPRRTPRPSPQKTPYLTKDSNVPGFTAWDVDVRIERMEGMFSEMQHKVTNTSLERSVLEEAIALYKERSKYPKFPSTYYLLTVLGSN